MTNKQMVLVDTNVILDVADADARWMEWSKREMNRFPDGLAINPLVYSELCYHAADRDGVEAMLATLGLQYLELPRDALFLAAQAFRAYRQRGGAKTSPLADFFIGAHAEAAGLSILTRDVARYQTYFPSVPLICP